jgi:hypothetical protein
MKVDSFLLRHTNIVHEKVKQRTMNFSAKNYDICIKPAVLSDILNMFKFSCRSNTNSQSLLQYCISIETRIIITEEQNQTKMNGVDLREAVRGRGLTGFDSPVLNKIL